MKTCIRPFLFITSFILLFSCGQKISHDKEVAYLTTFTTIMKGTTDTINIFWDQLVEAAESARQNQDLKLDSSYIDRLNKSYQKSTLILSSSIAKLSAVEEIDQEINLKEKTMTHLKNTKALQESALPHVINALSIGLDKLTEEQRESFKKFKEKGGELQAESAELEKLAHEFVDKHKITSEELAKYSL
ncbi:MAG: hypothetical protein ACXVPU_02875 [Bacteroidia bacterium]